MATSGADDPFAERREWMVRDQLASRGITQPELLDALRRIPREEFVPLALMDRAYDDGALSIGGGQTISQPYIVARMTQALRLPDWSRANPGVVPRVLDVGTGSGYQAAVLAALGADVLTIERDPELSAAAGERLRRLGFDRVELLVGDGSEGWPDRAPYAGIVVAAAAPEVPEPLVAQLAEGGRLVVPVGSAGHQELTVVRRAGDRLEQEFLEPCVFVPLVGRFGFRPA